MDENELQIIREAFARVLRQKRNELGLSQEELGFRAGIAMRYVSLLETGKRQPTLSTLASISKSLNITLSEFVTEIEAQR